MLDLEAHLFDPGVSLNTPFLLAAHPLCLIPAVLPVTRAFSFRSLIANRASTHIMFHLCSQPVRPLHQSQPSSYFCSFFPSTVAHVNSKQSNLLPIFPSLCPSSFISPLLSVCKRPFQTHQMKFWPPLLFTSFNFALLSSQNFTFHPVKEA